MWNDLSTSAQWLIGIVVGTVVAVAAILVACWFGLKQARITANQIEQGEIHHQEMSQIWDQRHSELMVAIRAATVQPRPAVEETLASGINGSDSSTAGNSDGGDDFENKGTGVPMEQNIPLELEDGEVTEGSDDGEGVGHGENENREGVDVSESEGEEHSGIEEHAKDEEGDGGADGVDGEGTGDEHEELTEDKEEGDNVSEQGAPVSNPPSPPTVLAGLPLETLWGITPVCDLAPDALRHVVNSPECTNIGPADLAGVKMGSRDADPDEGGEELGLKVVAGAGKAGSSACESGSANAA